MTGDETIGCHHRLDGYETEQALGNGEGPTSLVCCSPGVARPKTQLSDRTTAGLNHNLVFYAYIFQIISITVYHKMLNIVPWAI